MIYRLAFLSVLIAIESVFWGTCLSIFFPAKPSASFVQDFFTTNQHVILVKRDVFFLRLFIIVGVASFFVLMRYFKNRKSQTGDPLAYFISIQAFIVLTETFFLFKYAVYAYPLWLNGFYLTLMASVLSKIFSPEIIKFLGAFNQRLHAKVFVGNISFWLTVIGMVLIPLIIWVPDVEGAVARMFCGEQFHHTDWLLMSAGWAHLSGNILGVDNISRYGLGAPILVSELAQRFLGRFDYVNAVIVLMILSIVYYWIWFYSFRLILKDTAWAFIAIFLGIRLHFFHMETFPFIFTYPQVTPLRFFCDSFFFLFLILHIEQEKILWLYLASAVSGYAIFHITGEGFYILVTFYIFLVLRELFVALNPSFAMKRLNQREITVLVIIPWMVLFTLCWVEAGPHVFHRIFWTNQMDYITIVQKGFLVASMMGNLTAPFVDRGSVAFLLPVVYLFTLIIFIGKLMEKTLKKDGLIMACACIFILMSYHYHATVSNNMPSYLRQGVILAMVFIYVLKEMTGGLSLYHRRLCKCGCGVLVFICLVTTHMFLLHPNIFNLSRNPMTHPVVTQFPVGRNSYFSHLFISYPNAFKLPVNGLGQTEELLVTEDNFANDDELKEFYRKESDYSKDALLIQSLTSADEKVPVVSSFENLILMQAKRRPFFYTYFMVNSQPRRMRKFPTTVLFNKTNLLREMTRIETQKPEYIFVERTYLVSPIPQAYLYDNEDIVDVLSYIFYHYKPYKSGEFLVALKRK